MTDLHQMISALRRPGLLMRTARLGLAEYRRTPAMRRMFATAGAHSAVQIVATLLEKEAELEARRRAADTAYSPARHVEVLTALMAEARHLPPRTGPILVPLASAAPAAGKAPTGSGAARGAVPIPCPALPEARVA